MDYLFKNVKENIYVLAVWDSSWNSYNNCYLIVEEEGIILIDTGKLEHSSFLVQSLESLGKSPDDVILLLATHGHKDHIEGASIFTNAQKYIHPRDRHLGGSDSSAFLFDLPDRGILDDFDCQLVGLHTPGSVALFHLPSKVLFSGDFLCFFGDPLSEEGLVSAGTELRKAWLEYLESGGVGKDLNAFMDGLSALAEYDAEVLCTGHGGVLIGEIKSFVLELADAGKALQSKN